MAKLEAGLFRAYFGGSWKGKIFKNGEFQREITFNWNKSFGEFSAIGTEEGFIVPPSNGAFDNTNQVSIAGWKNDVKRWFITWHNEFGGYGELQWTSQELIDGKTVLYGSLHECKQESDDCTEHIVKCIIKDEDNFKYTIQSFRKGIVEIEVKRVRTSKELKKLMEDQTIGIKPYSNINEFINT
ncbi:MAG: hypothetical protein WBN28_01865 [Lutimonas sp.]